MTKSSHHFFKNYLIFKKNENNLTKTQNEKDEIF